MTSIRTKAFDRYCDAARPRTEVWRVFLVMLLIPAGILGTGVGIGAALIALGVDASAARMTSLNTPGAGLFVLSTFIIWWVALALLLRLFHRRPMASLFGGRFKAGLRPFAIGLGLAIAVSVVSGLIGGAIAGVPGRSDLPAGIWAASLLLALPLLAVQTGAEEVLFRGYLMQQLGARFRSPLIWMILPSLIFGALHWNPAAPGNTALVMIITASAGLIFALMTLRTGGLGLAWGAHFGMNLMAILVVSQPDYFSGLSLWHWRVSAEELMPLLWLDLVTMAIALAATAFWAMRPMPSPPER